MNVHFEKLTASPNQFFTILPEDWQNLIVPHWNLYKNTASIYVLKENDTIVAGGIVFSEKLLEMTPFEEEFCYLFSEGYLYLGYIWVAEDKRNKRLATTWLTHLKQQNPIQKYWLTIEEESLTYFYERNDFKLLAKSNDATTKEWLMVNG